VYSADGSSEKNSENWHQVQLFHWAEGEIAKGRDELKLLGAIPNGFRQVKLGYFFRGKELGFKKGMPDIYLLLPRSGWHGLFIELKSTKKSARNSQNQRQMQRLLTLADYKVQVCMGHQSAINLINWYCELEKDEKLP
jgi:hypothetical protein